jgi:hypothetical protein
MNGSRSMMKIPTPRIDLPPSDRAALEQAIMTALQIADRPMRERFEDKLVRRPWLEVAEDAAVYCQDRLLRLRPWMPAPCTESVRTDIDGIIRDGDDGVMGWYRAARVAKRLLDLGLSVYEPDPLASIAAAEAERV